MTKVFVEWKSLLIAFAIGVLLAFVVVNIHSKKEIRELKQFGDSVAVVATQRESTANRLNDSVKVVVAALETTQHQLLATVRVSKKIGAQLDTALTSATTTADSLAIRTQQVTNLRNVVLTLEQAVANVTAQRDEETRRADKNLVDLNAANADIIKLNNQIQGLGPTLPGWARTTIEVAKLGTVFYAGIEAGKAIQRGN